VARYGAEQPVCLAIDPVGKVEGSGISVAAPYPEPDRPKAAWRRATSGDRDRSGMLPRDRVVGVDLAMEKAEVADQQFVGKSPKTGWCERNPPWRSEMIARHQSGHEVAVFVKNGDGAVAEPSVGLSGTAGRRVGHVNETAYVLNFERDEPGRERGVDECAGPEADGGEGAVEDVNAAGAGVISGIEPRLCTVDRQPGIDRPRRSSPG